MRRTPVGLAVLALLLLAACSSQAAPPATPAGNLAPPAGGVKEFTLTIGHTRYDPALFEVGRGDRVIFNVLAKEGTGPESGYDHMHGISIDEFGINQVATSEVTPVRVEFVADKAGSFDIYCKTCWDGPFGTGHPNIRAKLVVSE
jgi:hypothetical protein